MNFIYFVEIINYVLFGILCYTVIICVKLENDLDKKGEKNE